MGRRAYIGLAVALLLAPLLLGMGGGGGAPVSDTIPRPDENHTATLKDRQGVVTEVSHLACGGKTYLPLRRGEGTLMVPFAKARRVTLGEPSADWVAATVYAEGMELAGTLSVKLEVTGVTELGNYRVPLKGLSEISLR